MKPYFPLFVPLEGRSVLIVGGGAVALRKAEKLTPYAPALRVLAPEILPALETLAACDRRAFRPADLEGDWALVIAATDDPACNREIAALCRARGVPVNAVDDPEGCTFFFPALAQRGSLSVGVCTAGQSPALAGWVRARVEDMLPARTEEILDFLGQERAALRSSEPDGALRAAKLNRLAADCLDRGAPPDVRVPPEGQASPDVRVPDSAQPSPDAPPSGAQKTGEVFLVGAGCGAADLITVRGLRLIQSCDALLYDDLIDGALLDEAPPHAERVYMGKRAGRHAAPQAAICAELIRQARLGRRVVRLKGGDPYLFGRGGEELLALRAAGIPCQEVPGIPSAIAIPAEVGIPVTHRGVSRSVHILTGHTAGTPDGLPAELDSLAHTQGTLVILMGLANLERIAERLLAAGMPADTPAAVLSGGSSPHPAQVRAPLAQIAGRTRAAGVQAPAVIVIGGVAAMG